MGGSPSIPQRNLPDELNKIFGKGVPLDLKGYNNFWQSEPLLSGAHDFALNNLTNINELVDPLQKLYGTLPGQVGQSANQLGSLNTRLGNLYRNLPSTSGLTSNLTHTLRQLPAPGELTSQLQQRLGQLGNVYNTQIQPGLMSGGALNAAQNRDVEQATRADFAVRGNVMGNQALGTELLNRDQYRRQRFNELLGQGLGISGEQRGLTSGIESVYDQNAAARLGLTQGIEGINTQDLQNRLGITAGQSGIIGQQAGLLGSEAGLASGLASGIQGVQQGGLNQALGVEQGQIGSWASLINPLLSYGQDVASSNQNAGAAQSIAGGNKTQGAIGGGLSILGSVAAAY